MATNTARGRTVFVLGTNLSDNREAVVVENGAEYSMDPAAIVNYTDATAAFPYSV